MPPNYKLPNIEVTELAVWLCDVTKACCVFASKQLLSCHLKSESMSHIPDPTPKK